MGRPAPAVDELSPTDMDRITRAVAEELAALQGERRVALVGTTARAARDFAVLPRRHLWGVDCANFLVGAKQAAAVLLALLDGQVETVFVDVERKVDFDLYALAGRTLRTSRRVSYKPNDATVVAADELFRWAFDDDLAGREILVYGLGNLGAKLALRLAERGASIHCLGRSYDKVHATADVLSALLPGNAPNSVRAVNGHDAIRDGQLDAMITFISASQVIGPGYCRMLKPGALVADGGIDNYMPSFFPAAAEKGLRCLRLDVRLGAPSSLLSACGFSQHFFEDVFGRRDWEGLPCVAGGMIGQRGEVILDQILTPRQVIGIANGIGGLVPSAELTPDDARNLSRAKTLVEYATKATA